MYFDPATKAAQMQHENFHHASKLYNDISAATKATHILYIQFQSYEAVLFHSLACQQRTLTPPDTWSCPTLGLACVLMLRPISPDLVLFPDFEFRTSQSVLLIILIFWINRITTTKAAQMQYDNATKAQSDTMIYYQQSYTWQVLKTIAKLQRCTNAIWQMPPELNIIQWYIGRLQSFPYHE